MEFVSGHYPFELVVIQHEPLALLGKLMEMLTVF